MGFTDCLYLNPDMLMRKCVHTIIFEIIIYPHFGMVNLLLPSYPSPPRKGAS